MEISIQRETFAIVLIVASGILLFFSLPASVIFGWAGVLIYLSYFQVSIALASHWRFLPIGLANLIVTIIVTCSLFQDIHLQPSAIISLAVVLWVFSALSYLLKILFPCPITDQLSGKYKCIGTSSLVIKDSSDKVQHIQLWFPINDRSPSCLGRRAILWTSGDPLHQVTEILHLIRGMAQTYSLPSVILSHLVFAQSRAHWTIQCDNIIDESLPVAIYSHGMYGWRQVHTTACEHLASHGFLVVAMDHEPDCMVFRPVGSPHMSTYFDYDLPDGLSKQEERVFYSEGMDRRAKDVVNVIDWLCNQDSLGKDCPPLKSRVNKARIHLWGHSFGGGTVATVCCRDTRVLSAVLLDSWMYPVPDQDRNRGSLNASLLLLSAERWQYGKHQAPFRSDLVAKSKLAGRSNCFDMIVKNTDHQNYCDTRMVAGEILLRRPALLGDVDSTLFSHGIDQILVDFFTSSVNDSKSDVSTKPISVGSIQIEECEGHGELDGLRQYCKYQVTNPTPAVQYVLSLTVAASSMPDFANYDAFNACQS